MKRLIKLIFLILTLYLTIQLVTNPKSCLEAAKNAVDLCLNTVIPSLFPFFVCSGLLSALGFAALCSRMLSPLMRPLFNLPGSGALTFALGILSGYPIGAATAAEHYLSGQCTKTEAERMLAFCNNSGPLFVIGVVGSGYLKNPALGSILYVSHIISAMLVGIVFRFYKASAPIRPALPPTAHANKKTALFSLGGIIDSSVFSILKVCGFVIFFAVLAATLPGNPILYSFIEITGGIRALSQCDGTYLYPLISFFIAFSGLSVMCQVWAITDPHGLSLTPYVFGKLLQGIFSFGITKLLLTLLPLPQETFLQEAPNFLSSYTPLALGFSSVAASLFAALSLILLMLPQTLKKTERCKNKKTVKGRSLFH